MLKNELQKLVLFTSRVPRPREREAGSGRLLAITRSRRYAADGNSNLRSGRL